MKYFIGLCLSFVVLSGCSVLDNYAASSKLVVQYATLKFVMNEVDGVERSERAAAILSIAEEGRVFFDARSLPVIEIERLLRERIDWSSLDVADTLLVNALIDRIALDVRQSVTLGDDVYVTGSKVLGWVVEGVRLSGLV